MSLICAVEGFVNCLLSVMNKDMWTVSFLCCTRIFEMSFIYAVIGFVNCPFLCCRRNWELSSFCAEEGFVNCLLFCAVQGFVKCLLLALYKDLWNVSYLCCRDICEISLIAVNTHDVLNANKEDTQYCEVTFLPRIVNEMTLCGCYHSPFIRFDWTITTRVNSPHSTRTSMSWSKTICPLFPLLCLVAHDRNAYDFPLLKDKSGPQLYRKTGNS